MRPSEEARDDRFNNLFRARLDQIINLKHELAQLAGKIDWDWIDDEVAPLYSARAGLGSRRALGTVRISV